MRKKLAPGGQPLHPDIQRLLDEYRQESRVIEAYHAFDFRRTFMRELWQDTQEQTPVIVINGQEPNQTVRQVCQKVVAQAAKWMMQQGVAYLSSRTLEPDHTNEEAVIVIDANKIVRDEGQEHPLNEETDKDDREHVFNEKRGQRHPDRTAPGRGAHDPHDISRHAGNQQPPSVWTANRGASGGPSATDDQ